MDKNNSSNSSNLNTLSQKSRNNFDKKRYNEDGGAIGGVINNHNNILNPANPDEVDNNDLINSNTETLEQNDNRKVNQENPNELNEKIIIDEHILNNIEEKVTIEIDNENNNDNHSTKHKQPIQNNVNLLDNNKHTIESRESSNDGTTLLVKQTQDYNKLNLLDDKSSYNISVINSPKDETKDKDLSNLNDKTKSISIYEKHSVNKRYENLLDENISITGGKSGRSVVEKFEEKIFNIDLNSLAEELTDYILEDLLVSEVKKDNQPLIPKKTYKYDRDTFGNLNNSLNTSTSGILNMRKNSGENPMNDTNISGLSNVLNTSTLMKTIIDLKKETTLSLYPTKIAPKLINKIGEKIYNNYETIYYNLSIPYSCTPNQLINSILSREPKKSHKELPDKIKDKYFIDKKVLISEFENTNKKIRYEDNIISDNYYDNILNECVIDAANELLNAERKYGDLGEPLPWSTRNRVTKFKHSNTNYSKNNLKNFVEKELTGMINFKLGLIAENHEYLENDQLNAERERRLMSNIIKEVFLF